MIDSIYTNDFKVFSFFIVTCGNVLYIANQS